MGYAFLYGVVGSLVGSNLGGVMYESMLKPLAGRSRAAVAGELRQFWLVFAAMGVVAVAGLMLYNRFFATDTEASNRSARRIMMGIYSVLIALGAWFFHTSGFAGATVSYRTMVQALIMLFIGIGGIEISLRHRHVGTGPQ